MRVLYVSWDPESDVTKLKFNDDFLSSDWTVRADVLKDLVVELTDMYEGMLTPPKQEEEEEGEEDMKIWCNPGESVLEMIHRQAEKD